MKLKNNVIFLIHNILKFSAKCPTILHLHLVMEFHNHLFSTTTTTTTTSTATINGHQMDFTCTKARYHKFLQRYFIFWTQTLTWTIFLGPFYHEKRVLEDPNFVTFPNSLWTFRKSNFFLVFHRVFGWSRRCGHFEPPHSMLKLHPEAPTIRVKERFHLFLERVSPAFPTCFSWRDQFIFWTWQNAFNIFSLRV